MDGANTGTVALPLGDARPLPAGGLPAALLVFLATVVLTLLAAVPVILAPSERIFGNEIAGRHHDPFTVMQQFAGASVPAPYLQPATDLPGRLLARVMSPVAAYNVMVLATFPLAALTAYWLSLEITGSIFASAIAGLAFAFSPFHVAHAAYHPHIAQVQWMALYLVAVWRCLHGLTVLRAAFLALPTGLVTASNFYGGFIAMVLTPVVVPLFWLCPSPAGGARRRRDLLGTSLVLGGLAVLMLGLLVAFAPDVWHQARAVRAEYPDLFRYSARWWAHGVPPVDHPLLGTWAQDIWRGYDIGPALLEQQVYLGLGVVALAAFAGWQSVRGRDRMAKGTVPMLALLAGAALLCALSPAREIGGWRFVRPSAALYDAAPMFRSYARFSVVVQLMVAILAGIGARSAWRSRRPLARAVVAGLLAIAVFEYAPWPWRSRDVLPTTAHRRLAAAGGSPRVFDCSDPDLAEHATAWLSGYPIAYSSPARPDCGDPGLGPYLAHAGFTHVLARANEPGSALLHGRERTGLRRVYQAADSELFDVTSDRPIAHINGMKGWYPREYDGGRSWRWSSGRSILSVWNSGGARQPIVITLVLGSFMVPRHMEVSLNGAPVAALLVSTASEAHRVGPIELPQGESDLVLAAREPALRPETVDPHSTDPRPLAFHLLEATLSVAP